MPLFAFVALVVHFVMRLSKSFMRIDRVSCRFPSLDFIKTSSNETSVITFFLTLSHMLDSIQTLFVDFLMHGRCELIYVNISCKASLSKGDSQDIE